jgi:hypothetical protein
VIELNAQVKKDSVTVKNEKKTGVKGAFRKGMKLISTTPKDTVKNVKSANRYEPYSGKIIRSIDIEHIGFEKSIYDTAKKVKKIVADVSNFLHVNTLTRTIKNHLFFRKNDALNPYKMADNERFLRDKDFILDCRFVIEEVPDTDSIDVLVLTRDVFSIGGSVGGSPPSSLEFSVFDANLSGRGQRLEYFSLLEQDRSPGYGYGLLFTQSSIFGSLANLELLYTQINAGRSIGKENEYSMAVRLKRPLVSPYARIAGGFEYSRNWSENVYNESVTEFLDYEYTILDAWIGYNIGIKRAFSNRNRQFLAIRYVDGVYEDQPEQIEYAVSRKYNNQKGFLGEFTFYRQNFFQTRYVYGFGRTEDVPAGITASVTGGLVRILSIQRPYGGIKAGYGYANRKGNFFRAALPAGTFVREKRLEDGFRFEDVVLSVAGSYFSRAMQVGSAKWRSYFSLGYSQINNRTTQDYMKIPSSLIPGFGSDSIFASKRVNAHLETAFYLPIQFIGFRFAPFAAVDLVGVTDCHDCTSDNTLYYGISGGLRTRNENLIFGTMELKITYIPEDEFGDSKINIGFKQNLRVKNSGSFVRPPQLVRYN